ncbi:MAG TPA: pyruvate dehydrogenase complex dihydrolipoamide acetyltransferase, partial [Xanthobacteraceae bacterium]|nr:pyruvate dehydrogenase complex dihydrolipoamide acetyltransferase [Xanthobacteraceae bacterium]
PGDVIAEIETDKATMEVEAVDEGVLAKIVVPEGTADVPVNQLIAVLAGEGEDVKATAAAAGKDGGGARPPAPPQKPSAAAPYPQRGEGAAPAPAARPSPPPAPQAPVTSPQRAEVAARSAAGEGIRTNGGGRIFASPLARRLAKEAGIDVARVQGSGPHGRVIARDIAAAREGRGLAPAPAAAAPGTAPPPMLAPSDDKIRALFAPGSYEVVPHDNMRKIIAQRLQQAKQTIPHFYLTIDCDIGKLVAAREEINAAAPKDKDGKPAWKLSVNDFVIKALALALQRVPEANVTWTESAMLKHKVSDVAVAVAIPGGLITPVVRSAETKSLSAISNEMRDLAARARARKLKPEEYQGGSTAVSNLGMYGIKDFAAVINPPHATILAVGAGEERPVVRNGKIEAATLMTVTLSTDHRAVDGALGSELIGAFKRLIENPVMMVV